MDAEIKTLSPATDQWSGFMNFNDYRSLLMITVDYVRLCLILSDFSALDTYGKSFSHQCLIVNIR